MCSTLPGRGSRLGVECFWFSARFNGHGCPSPQAWFESRCMDGRCCFVSSSSAFLLCLGSYEFAIALCSSRSSLFVVTGCGSTARGGRISLDQWIEVWGCRSSVLLSHVGLLFCLGCMLLSLATCNEFRLIWVNCFAVSSLAFLCPMPDVDDRRLY
jgi:hypothetical protein